MCSEVHQFDEMSKLDLSVTLKYSKTRQILMNEFAFNHDLRTFDFEDVLEKLKKHSVGKGYLGYVDHSLFRHGRLFDDMRKFIYI